MKRVLHVIDHLQLGGAQSLLLDLVTLMEKSEWHCEVASMHGRGLFAELLEKKGISVHSLSPSLWPPCYLAAFASLQSQFDILHFHLSGSNWIAKPMAALLGNQPRISHDHGSDDFRFRGRGFVLMDAIMHRFSTHTIAVTPEVKQFLTHYEALTAESVTAISNGINVEEFRPFTSEEKKEARLFFDLPSEAFVVGTVGRLAPEKNQTLFLKAAKIALEQGLKATFLIAGTGPEEAALKKCAAQLGIEHSVRFLGQIKDRVQLYRSLDLFVLTSRFEGLPMVLLEAMASGIPVVSTDLEGIHHALEGGRHGLLIPSEDEIALSDCLLHSHERIQQESLRSARLKVESDFSAQKAAKKLGDLYQSLLSPNISHRLPMEAGK
ncbi:MAG: glycosyltransferase [Verrucomicrobia bacterium]|nr:MAG: glycosyltransferase [Verrucomicrobiota bacterium]